LGAITCPEGVYGLPLKALYIHEVVDHLYILVYAEGFQRFLTQVIRYGGNGVRLVDGKCDDRFVCFVAANEGDVRSVKGGDIRNAPALVFFQYLLGHIGGRGVRNGIVHMKQVQVIIERYVHQGGGEGRFIGWVIKQGIGRDAYLVIKDIGIEAAQPYWLPDTLQNERKCPLSASAFPNSVARTPLPPNVG
jgi:hypothetical protein